MPNLKLFKHAPLAVFMAIYLILAVFTYKNYGISWDEQNVYTRATNLYTYLFTKDVDPQFSYPIVFRTAAKDVNVFYNSIYTIFLYAFNKTQSYEIYHLYNLLFCSVLFAASYFLLYKQTKNSLISLLGPLFILLTPRFFGDMANNPKDMPFAVFYFLSLVAMYTLRNSKNQLAKALILGGLIGVAQSLRIVGFTLYVIFIMFELYHAYLTNRVKNLKSVFRHLINQILPIAIIFIVANFIMAITWPYLGSNYFKHFLQMFMISVRFPEFRNILFMGHEISQSSLPWFYLPVWIAITTPIFILFFLLCSVFFIKNKRHNEVFTLLGITIAFNLLLYFITRPEVYNGLRHYLFLLPIMATLAALSVGELIKNFKYNFLKFGIIALVLVNMLLVIISMVKLHPYEYIYFNELIGGVDGARGNFEMDYWGESNREAALWLKQYVSNKPARVYVCGNVFSASYHFSSNMKFEKDVKNADYAICHTWGNEYKKIPGQILHTVEKEGTPLNYVFQLR